MDRVGRGLDRGRAAIMGAGTATRAPFRFSWLGLRPDEQRPWRRRALAGVEHRVERFGGRLAVGEHLSDRLGSCAWQEG